MFDLRTRSFAQQPRNRGAQTRLCKHTHREESRFSARRRCVCFSLSLSLSSSSRRQPPSGEQAPDVNFAHRMHVHVSAGNKKPPWHIFTHEKSECRGAYQCKFRFDLPQLVRFLPALARCDGLCMCANANIHTRWDQNVNSTPSASLCVWSAQKHAYKRERMAKN
jgi:hypothetical protein